MRSNSKPGKIPEIFETAFKTYRRINQINQGGCGTLFKVTDEGGQEYALKLLNKALFRSVSSSELRVRKDKIDRFMNEVMFCSCSTHPNIVKILDYGFVENESPKIPFCVMKLYSRSLRELIDSSMQPEKILKAFEHIVSALKYAHDNEIWHRDLKPENILYDEEKDFFVVADFGIAHFEPECQAAEVQTGQGDKLCNNKYAAPEQRDGGSADKRADIYALGLILNEMFTGKVLQGTNHAKIEETVFEFGYLDTIVDQMTRQDPGERYQSIEEVWEGLNSYGYERQLTSPPERNLSKPLSVPPTERHLSNLYIHAMENIEKGQQSGARQSLDEKLKHVPEILQEFRNNHSNAFSSITEKDQFQMLDELVDRFAEPFLLSLAAAASGNNEFGKDVIRSLLMVKGWQFTDRDPLGELPETLGFIFHYLHGAKCAATGRLNLAFDLLRTPVKLSRQPEFQPIWEADSIIEWPDLMFRVINSPWNYVSTISERLTWLKKPFAGSSEKFQEALIAYNMALNVYELASRIAANEPVTYRSFRCHPHFQVCGLSAESAVGVLLSDPKKLAYCWEYWQLTKDQMISHWHAWTNKVSEYGRYKHSRKVWRPAMNYDLLKSV